MISCNRFGRTNVPTDDADAAVDVTTTIDDGEGLDNSGAGRLEADNIVSVATTTEHGEVETVELQIPSELDEDAGTTVTL